MNKWISGLCVVAVAGLLSAATAARADEEKVPVDTIPKPVVEALKNRFPGAELKGCEKEKDGDKVIYDVELKHKDQNYEVGVTPEGVIETIERQIDAKDLPKPVIKTLEEKYPKATYSMVEEVYKVKDKKETMEYYEIAVVTADKKKVEVLVAPDGKIVKPDAKPAPAAEKIAPDKLPKAVMDAIKGRFPDADITGAEKETEDGKIVYDIELKSKGKKYEMDIEENGTIIEIEKEVAAKDLPEGVTKAIEAKYPKAKIKEIMEVNKVKDKKETPDHYEVIIETADKKEKEIEVSLDGKTIKEEGAAKEPKKEEGKDEGKVSLDKVPKVVMDALKAKYAKAEIVSAEKGDQDGTKVFEFELKEGKKTWEASFTPEGKFVSSEEPVQDSELPAKVKEAFQKKYPNAKIVEMEKEITGEGNAAKVVYEIIIETAKGKLEIQFDPDGKVLGEEAKK